MLEDNLEHIHQILDLAVRISSGTDYNAFMSIDGNCGMVSVTIADERYPESMDGLLWKGYISSHELDCSFEYAIQKMREFL